MIWWLVGVLMSDTAYDALIRPVATQHAIEAGLDPDAMIALVKAVIRQESRFDPRAYRAEPQIHDASRGLMQVLERTARELGYSGSVGNDQARTGGLYTPSVSIALGTKLLAQNLRWAGGKLDVAVSAYNAGFSAQRPHDAKRTITGGIINQAYVDSVLGYFRQYVAQEPTTATAAGNGVTAQASAALNPLTWWGLVAILGGGVALWLFFR